MYIKSDTLLFQLDSHTIQIGWDPQTAIVVELFQTDLEFVLSTLESWKNNVTLPTKYTDIFEKILLKLEGNNLLFGSKEIVETQNNNYKKFKIRIHGKGQISDYLGTTLRKRNIELVTSSQRIRSHKDGIWDDDLVIFSDSYVPDPSIVNLLMKKNIPHLSLYIRDDKGILGPLVIPHKTSCLKCANIFRTEADPNWPIIANQLVYKPSNNNTSLANIVGAVTLHEIDNILNDRYSDHLENTTLEICLNSLEVTRKYWPKHPECDCTI